MLDNLDFPLIYSAGVTLASTTTGGVNTNNLVNNTGKPLELLEIGFSIRYIYNLELVHPPGGAGIPIFQTDGSGVSCQLVLGSTNLTNGYIPIWSFDRDNADQDVIVGNDSSGQFLSAFYGWRLKYPLVIRPGEVLVPSFQHNGSITAPITVTVTYRMRPAAQSADATLVPYVASYTSKAFDLFGPQDTDSSSELDLSNPFSTDLTVHRFVHRSSVVTSQAGTGASTGLTFSDSDGNNALFDGLITTMTLYASDGTPVVEYPTPLRMAFGSHEKSWGFEALLPPSHFYIAALQKAQPSGSPGNPSTARATISMICTQKVSR